MRARTDMMNMSYDDLRSEVAPNARTVMPVGMSMGAGSMLGGPSHALGLMGSRGQPQLTMHAPAMPLVIPDHPQELHVFLSGDGAEEQARSSNQLGLLEPAHAMAACKGKRDFIMFEPLDDAVRQGTRLVIVLPMGSPKSEVKRAQVYLASSLARWLKEQKTDGSGRPYGECKDEDPTLRKHFTRAQINAILAFGEE